MDAKLHLANLLAQGLAIPEDTHIVEVEIDNVSFYRNPEVASNWQERYISAHFFDNPRVAYDTYTLEFENRSFTLQEFNEWLADNPNIVQRQAALQKRAMIRLAELAEIVSDALAEGESLAAEAGLPFMVSLGGSMQDVRKLTAVDWDSSSMYC